METRRAKWRRLAKPECTREDGSGTLFSLLDLDVRTHILRYLSTRPCHWRWRAFITPSDAVRAFAPAHPLRGVARTTLTSLHVHYGYAQVRDRIACGIQSARAGGDDSFEELLAAQAARLRVLTIDFKYEYNFLCGALYGYCAQLRVLVLGFDHRKFSLEPILGACGNVLQVLHLAYEDNLTSDHVKSITEHCRALAELTLDHETTDESLQPLWEVCGRTLRRITVWPPRIRFADSLANQSSVDAIARHCHRLSDVEITRTGRKLCASTASILNNLGTRLEVLRLMQKDALPDANAIRAILRKCRRAVLHLNIQRSEEVVDVLELAGSRLVEAKIRHNFQVDDRFRNAADALVKLKVLTLFLRPNGAGAREFLEALFHTPKKQLQKLVLPRAFYDEPGGASALPTIARGTGALRDLEIWCSRPCTGEDVGCLFRANRDLKRLWIWNRIKAGSTSGVKTRVIHGAASIIRTMEVLGLQMRELVVKDQYIKRIEGEISDACVQIRYRRQAIDVIVGSVRYLPVAEKLQRKTIQY